MEETIVEEAKTNNSIVELPISELRANPYQPRKVFDEVALNELAESIKVHGVFQPIIVKKSIKGYEIIAGERRFRASKLAGMTTIPAIVKDFTDDEMMQIALLENLQRENLTAIEEAKASVQDMVLYNKISMGHARVLSKLDDVQKQEDLAQQIIDEDLSVRALENMVSNNIEKLMPNNRKTQNNEYKHIESYLKEKLGTGVKMTGDKISIKFSSVHDLNTRSEIMNIDINE